MSVYDFTVKDNKGNDVSLGEYKGKVLLIVNTATKCGLTPQYELLEQLYEKYRDSGLEVLDFPCNQFMKQAPGTDEEINEFCTLKFGTMFPRFQKIDVNGPGAAPLYVWLKEQAPVDKTDEKSAKFAQKVKLFTRKNTEYDIKWNFGKFLVGKDGEVVERYSPAFASDELAKDIERELAK